MEAEVRCRCDRVHGTVANASSRNANRVVCLCDDCQAFLHHLGRPDLLDEHGGTDIVQVAPASLSFDRGTEHIACVRLSAKGSHRFFARCCNTPVGNTASPAIPFVGIVARAFDHGGRSADDVFGKPIGALGGKFAIGEPPPGSDRPNPRLLARAIFSVLGWKVGGKTWPHPFFERATRSSRYPVSVLESSARDALRPLCGPKPA